MLKKEATKSPLFWSFSLSPAPLPIPTHNQLPDLNTASESRPAPPTKPGALRGDLSPFIFIFQAGKGKTKILSHRDRTIM